MVSKQVIRVIIEAEETISKAAKQAEKAIKDMGKNGKSGMDEINQASKTAHQNMSKMEKFVRSVQTKFESLRNKGSSAFNAIKQKASSAVNSIGKITNVSQTASKAMDRIKSVSDGVKSKFAGLKSTISSFGSSSKKTFDDVSNSEKKALIPLQQLGTESKKVSSNMNSSFINVKATVTDTGSRFGSLQNKIRNLGTSAKTALSPLGTTLDNIKNKIRNLGSSADQTKPKIDKMAQSAQNSGRGFGFLNNVLSMTIGMIGYDLFNSFMQYGRAAINAEGQLKYFAERLNMSTQESKEFNATLEQMQLSFRKVDMKAVGASAEEMAVKLNLPKEALVDLTKVTAVMSSAFVKEGRTQEDAILAVSDAMDGQFRRLQELGISQDMLIKNGWSGDLNDKVGLLKAMNVTLDEMGFTETAQDITSLDDAFQALSVAGGQLLASILIPITPFLVQIAEGAMKAFDGIKQFANAIAALFGEKQPSDEMNLLSERTEEFSGKLDQLNDSINPIAGSMQNLASSVEGATSQFNGLGQAWDNLPDWAQFAIGLTGVSIAAVLLGTVLWTTVVPSLVASTIATINWIATALGANVSAITLSGAFGLLGSTIWAALSPALPFIAAFVAIAVVVYEVGKSFGWWKDIPSMLDAIKTGIMTLWEAFINNPHVQEFLQALGAAWDRVCQALQPVISWAQKTWNELFPPGQKWDILTDIINAFGWLGDRLAEMVGFAQKVWGAFNQVMNALGPFGNALLMLGGPVGMVVGILRQIICILLGCSPGIVPALETVQEMFMTVWNAIVGILAGIIPTVISAIQPILDILTAIGNFLLGAFQFAWQTIILVFMTVWNHLQLIITIFSQFLSGQISLQAMLTQIWQVIKSMFFSVLTLIISRVSTFAKSIVDKAIAAAWGFVNSIISRISSLPGRVWSLLLSVVGRILSAGVSWVTNASSVASNVVSSVINWIKQLPGKVYTEFINIGSKMLDAGGKLVQDAMNIGKNIVDGLLGAMGIHSPGTIQTKVIQEFVDMLSGVEEQMKPAAEIAKEFGETIVDEFGNPTLNADTSLVQDLDAPKMDMSVGMDTSSLASANEEVIGQYDNLANTTGLSLQNMVNQDKLAFNNIRANDTAQMTTITSTVGNKMRQMTNHVQTNMNSIVAKNKQGFTTAKNNTATQLNSMVKKTQSANSQMINSWKHMSNDVINFAGKIKTQSSNHFNQLGSRIGSFYRKLQNPGGFGAGPATPSGRPSTAKRAGTSGFKTIANVIRKYSMPETMTISEVKRNPLISNVDIGGYISNNTNKFNVADLIQSGNIPSMISFEHPMNKGAGAWLDNAGKHISKIKSTANKWRMKGPKIIGKYQTSIGFKVGDFKNSVPKIDFATFKRMAEDVFSQCHYEFYYDSNKYGNWMNAFRGGGMNCSDSSDALIAFAHACGLPASKVHGHWNQFGHFWANVAGHKMDTTGWMQQRNWTPSASHAGPAPRGLTFGEFIDAIKQTNESEQIIVPNDSEDVEINGKITVEHVHKFLDLPDNVSAEEVARLINEAPEDDNWLIKLIKKIVGDREFQKLDLKEKAKIERKNNRAMGV